MTDQLFDLFLRCFPEYQTSRELFAELLKPEEAHVIAEYAQGQLAGYAMVHGGSIPVLCVGPEHRRQGIGSRLLAAAEGYIRSIGEEHVTLGCGENYLLQGVPNSEENLQFFQKRGYSAAWTSVDMGLSLEGFSSENLNIPPAPEGVTYRFAEPADKPALLSAVKDAESSWVGIFETCADPIHLAILDGEIVGFQILEQDGGRFHEPGQQVGSVGCVGVVNAQRERGIGLRMVAEGLKWLKSQGCTTVELRYTWLTDWYGKVGFRVVSEQWMGEKDL